MKQPSGVVVHHHAPPQGFIRKHIFSLDHKVIGKQYYGLALVAVFIGMILSWLMRWHLAWPAASMIGLDKFHRTARPAASSLPSIISR